ncbi:MAG: hypothetical protein ACRCW0_02850 [Clostridium sp.]
MIFVSKEKKMRKKKNRKILGSVILSILTAICITGPNNDIKNNSVVAQDDNNKDVEVVSVMNVTSEDSKETFTENNNVKKIQPSNNSVDLIENNRFSRGGDVEETVSVNTNNPKSIENNTKGVSISAQKDIIKEVKPKVENLDWFKEAQYIYPIGAVAEVEDVYTGKTFKVQRTFGTNHADVEALTKNDSEVIKNIWGGDFSWERRPVIVFVNGRRIAASMAAMPHAGNDEYPALSNAPNLSGGYGTGQNLDVVKNNGMSGVCDLHFLNSMRHTDGSISEGVDSQHQSCVTIAASQK